MFNAWRPSPRLLTLTLLLAAVGALVWLSAGLSTLNLTGGGIPLAGETMQPPAALPTTADWLRTLYTALRLLLFAVLVLAVLVALRHPRLFWREWKRTVPLLAFFLLLALFAPRAGDLALLEQPTMSPDELPQPPSDQLEAAQPVAVPDASAVPAWLPWAVAALSATAVVAVGWRLARRRAPQPTAADPIERAAQEALDQIAAGDDWRNAVIACYEQMAATLAQERAITRPLSTTAREFETQLQQRGLPTGPVQRLTRLFEQVRYGRLEPAVRDEREARDCLAEIAAAARRAPGSTAP